MNFDLLRSWLGLPPGPWPPDHYALLGFPPGHAEAAEFEPRVLLQMERLRTHQLLQPDLVTEGMNRLAQALITLTDPAAKSAYDSDLKIAAAPAGEQSIPVRQTSARTDSVMIAEPVFDELPEAEPVPEPTQEILLPAELIPPYQLVELEDPLPVREPPPVASPPAVRPWPTPAWTRRAIYARLALIRKGRRAWLRLKPVMLDPGEPLDRPGRVVLLLEAAEAIRPLLPALARVVGDVQRPGGLVAAILKQPFLLDTIRRLLPDQRQSLSTDWRAGLRQLELESARLRQVARDERSKAEGIQRTPAILLGLRRFPEWLLVAFAGLILLLAAMRSALSRSP